MSRKGRHSKLNSVNDGLDKKYASSMTDRLLADLSTHNPYEEMESSKGLSKYIRFEDSDVRVRISNHLPFGYPSKMSEAGLLPDFTLELHEGMGGTRQITINGVTVSHYHRDDYEQMVQDIGGKIQMGKEDRDRSQQKVAEAFVKFNLLTDSEKMSFLSQLNEDNLMPHNYYIGIRLEETTEQEDEEFLQEFRLERI